MSSTMNYHPLLLPLIQPYHHRPARQPGLTLASSW